MAIPREGSRDTGDGYLISNLPDWCVMPGGGGPIPFNISAIQGDDAGTAATVRQTGLRSHTSASLITHCTGDEPGQAGVSSGTIGSVCQPKTWSTTVRFEGNYAVRHNDEWYMNNKNTTGKLFYVENSNKYDPTPQVMRDATPDPVKPGQQYAQALPFVEPLIDTLGRVAPDELPPGTVEPPETITPPDTINPANDNTMGGPKGAPQEEAAPQGRPRPDAMPLPSPGNNRTSDKCPVYMIYFDPKSYHLSEYRNQLAMQQQVLNKKSSAQCASDIQYNNDPANKASNEQLANQARTDMRNKALQSGQDLTGLAAAHRLDTTAGGNPSDIAGMYDSSINSSIGWNWGPGGNRDEMLAYAKDAAKNNCPCRVILVAARAPYI